MFLCLISALIECVVSFWGRKGDESKSRSKHSGNVNCVRPAISLES